MFCNIKNKQERKRGKEKRRMCFQMKERTEQIEKAAQAGNSCIRKTLDQPLEVVPVVWDLEAGHIDTAIENEGIKDSGENFSKEVRQCHTKVIWKEDVS